jgi:hypothetical protein
MLKVNQINSNQISGKNSPTFGQGWFKLQGPKVVKHASEIKDILTKAGANFIEVKPSKPLSGTFFDTANETVLAALKKLGQNEKYAPLFQETRFFNVKA